MFDQYDVTCLKLHVDNEGLVWYADGLGPPVFTNQVPPAFLTRPIVQDAKHIRMIGCEENAHLILTCYIDRINRGEGTVEVCTPLVCETNRVRATPELAVNAMRTCNLPISLGGWHEFGKEDYPAYALASSRQKYGSLSGDNILQLLKQHPVWPSLSFVGNMDPYCCAALLGLTLDPRWYVDTVYPQRNSKFNAFLGLTLQNQSWLTQEAKEVMPYGVMRCQLVLDCWMTGVIKSGDFMDPRFFLYRIYAHRKCSVKGMLRASQTFAAYLRYTWLAAIYRSSTKLNEPLFVPEQFFKLEREAEAYHRHMTELV